MEVPADWSCLNFPVTGQALLISAIAYIADDINLSDSLLWWCRMNHLILSFYLLALIAGTASITQTVLIYLRYRKIVVKQYGFFLLALYLFLFVFAIDLYARITSIADRRAVQNLVWIFQAAGGFTFIFTSPYFFHGLIGIEITKLLDGQTTKEIGDRLFVSVKTVENHVYNIYQKVNVKNRVQFFQLIRSNALE
jgi:hypothetical protein